ncbi:peptidase [Helicobacter valdiviensis]|uniref:Peptidase n=1 Tax=Helicobacter valdiviensis TaxID=1458358 RepID=A0A2W6NKC2_9HELI|nr:M23 family metallopeptidase [Helicobacter valdiviensis]PZT47846.1 peptidase [Helicobacter valdiviensis]
MKKTSSKGAFSKLLGLILVIIIVGGGVFVLTSSLFEKNPPKISLLSEPWWNLGANSKLSFSISDSSNLSNFSASLLYDGEKIPINLQSIPCNIQPQKETMLCFSVQSPNISRKNLTELTLEVSATDTSKWNFFKGNTQTQQFAIKIDTKRPQVSVLSNSYRITQGGSALVVFRVDEPNLMDLKISNGENEFIPQPFYKEGYYISLIAWPKDNANFKATIYANDKAGNISSTPINFYAVSKQYKTSNIPLTDKFIDGKISSLVEEIGQRSLDSFANKLEIFKYINEEIRDYSTQRIMEVSSNFSKDKIEDFKISPFSPLKNGAMMASFGDHRTFIYNGEAVSQSNHMGLDLASIKQAPVKLSNEGRVILNEFVGIDGNAVVVYHGLGLSTLYAHLTSSSVNVGDMLEANALIGHTGNTGLALGDHLHFSVLVQGYEVWTAEWMDSKWIENNITKVIRESKEIIDRISSL